MKKPVILIVLAVAVLALLAQNGSAFPTNPPPSRAPDGGATSLLLLGSVAGLAFVRKMFRK